MNYKLLVTNTAQCCDAVLIYNAFSIHQILQHAKRYTGFIKVVFWDTMFEDRILYYIVI